MWLKHAIRSTEHRFFYALCHVIASIAVLKIQISLIQSVSMQ